VDFKPISYEKPKETMKSKGENFNPGHGKCKRNPVEREKGDPR